MILLIILILPYSSIEYCHDATSRNNPTCVIYFIGFIDRGNDHPILTYFLSDSISDFFLAPVLVFGYPFWTWPWGPICAPVCIWSPVEILTYFKYDYDCDMVFVEFQKIDGVVCFYELKSMWHLGVRLFLYSFIQITVKTWSYLRIMLRMNCCSIIGKPGISVAELWIWWFFLALIPERSHFSDISHLHCNLLSHCCPLIIDSYSRLIWLCAILICLYYCIYPMYGRDICLLC